MCGRLVPFCCYCGWSANETKLSSGGNGGKSITAEGIGGTVGNPDPKLNKGQISFYGNKCRNDDISRSINLLCLERGRGGIRVRIL